MSKVSLRVCWSCKGPAPLPEDVCPTCQALQPPAPVSAFERFGLSPAIDIDLEALDKAYMKAQQAFHPDRYGGRSPQEKRHATQQTAAYNEAYSLLKDPIKRARHVLVCAGRPDPLAAEGESFQDAALLMEVMEWRSAVSEAGAPEERQAISVEVSTARDVCWEALKAALNENGFEEASHHLVRLKYFEKLLQECGS